MVMILVRQEGVFASFQTKLWEGETSGLSLGTRCLLCVFQELLSIPWQPDLLPKGMDESAAKTGFCN